MQIQAHACIGGKRCVGIEWMDHLPRLTVQCSVGEDIRKLDYGVHIVSGTPGELSLATLCGRCMTSDAQVVCLT